LAREIVELAGRMRWDKPIAGPQDVKVSGRLDTEIPAFHGTKNLHGFLLNPCMWRWCSRARYPPIAYNRDEWDTRRVVKRYNCYTIDLCASTSALPLRSGKELAVAEEPEARYWVRRGAGDF
jgi:hypothetical protein